MGQAKNRGSLEERVKNAKKFRKEAILSELKKIVEGHYQHVPDQFSHRQNYLDGCVIAMDIKEAMDIVSDDSDIGIIEDGCPKPEYLLGLFEVALDNYGLDDNENIQECAVNRTGFVGDFFI